MNTQPEPAKTVASNGSRATLPSSWWAGRDMVELSLLAGLLVSGSLLAGAHIFEYLGYEPCKLCLDQREAHWTAMAICGVGLFLALVIKAPRLAAAAVGTAALIYGFSGALSAYHTGVEFGYWPGPASCSSSKTITSVSDLSSGFDLSKPRVACDQVGWRFLGISMAGYNLLFSAGLFVLCLFGASRAFLRLRYGNEKSD